MSFVCQPGTDRVHPHPVADQGRACRDEGTEEEEEEEEDSRLRARSQ